MKEKKITNPKGNIEEKNLKSQKINNNKVPDFSKDIPGVVKTKLDQIKGDKNMYRAYQASTILMREEMKKRSPEDYKKLKNVKDSDIIVIAGQYDHGQVVFEMTEIPFTVVSPTDYDKIELREDQIVFINCPGVLTNKGIRKTVTFVEQGGLLVTTDWALKNVLELGFPNFVRYNKQPTGDEVVRVEFIDTDDKFLDGLIDKESDPVWWLEGSSYPIEVIDKDKVKVLVKSKEMKEKYGESAIVVTFEFGEGKVYHLTSHFYLQRTETRTKRHKKSSYDYAVEKDINLSSEDKIKFDRNFKDVSLGEVESAYTTQKAISNLVIEQKNRVAGRKRTDDEL